MELLVHASTSGHLIVACSLELAVVTNLIDVHVIMATPPTAHLLLWAMTIFVRVHEQRVIGVGGFNSSHMLNSGMARFVRVVAHAVSSTIRHGSPRT